MATRNWTEGNTAFATGFGGTILTGDDLLIEEGEDYIVTELNQAAKSFESLQVRSDVHIGVQSDGVIAGYLECDIDNTSDAYALFAGEGSYYLKGGSTTGTINNLLALMRGQGRLFLGAGTYANAECGGGFTYFGEDADPTTLWVVGGAKAHVTESGTAPTTIYVMGAGSYLEINRDFGTLWLGEGAQVWADGELITPTLVNQLGGRLEWNGGNIATYLATAGICDRTRGQRDVDIGATSLKDTPSWRFIKSDRAATTASTRDPIAGGSKSGIE